VEQLKQLIDNWILIAQGLIGSIGALAFLVALTYKPKGEWAYTGVRSAPQGGRSGFAQEHGMGLGCLDSN
jgi:hypothetical protein